MANRQAGFSLVECVAALACAAVLLAVAVPAWQGAVAAAQGGRARAALAATLLEAVQHSALAGVAVVVCPGSTTCSGSVDWSGGWMVFADLDGNRERDPGDRLLRLEGPLAAETGLRSTIGRTRLVFQPNGGNAGSNVTFTLCDRRGAGKASSLVLSNDGRLRTGTPTQAAVDQCLQGLH